MRRLKRMDGLRGLLATYVMLGHALPLAALPAWVEAPFRHGGAAVCTFFALSGLVIASTLERFNGDFPAFLKARVRRLLPCYFVVLAASIFITSLGDPLPALRWASPMARGIVEPGLPPDLWAHLVAHLVLVQGLIPQAVLPFAYVTLLGPAWSLSTEFQFYTLIGWSGPKHMAQFALALLGAAALYRLSPWQAEFSRAFLPQAAPYFALGIASALALHGKGWRLFWVCLAASCLLAGEEKALTPLLWACVVAAQTPRWGRVLEHPALLYLGAISYPLYLVNEPVQRLCALALMGRGPVAFTVLYLPLSLGGALALAALLHRFVEMQAVRRKVIAPVVVQ